MEDFQAFALLFLVEGTGGKSESVGLCEKQMECSFSLSVRFRWASLAGARPACPFLLLKSKPCKTLFHLFFTLKNL